MPGKTTFITTAAILLICLASSHGQDTDKVQFRLGLKEGQSFRSETITRQVITQSGGRLDIKVEMTMGTTYKFDVQGVAADGTATLKVTIERIFGRADVPGGQEVDYDSANPSNQDSPQTRLLAPRVGKSFIMEMNGQGKVTQVKGIETILEAMIAESGGAAVKEQMEKEYGRDATAATMQELLAPYPDEPVGVGDSWSNTVSVAGHFPMQIDSTYTLKGRAGGMATLAVVSTIKTDPNAEPIGAGPAKGTLEISGKRTGEIVVHETAGWTMSSKLATDFKGTRKNVGRSGMSIAIAVSGEVTVKTTK